MSTEWKPTLVERMYLRALDVLGRLTMGHADTTVVTEMVRTLGVRDSMRHMMAVAKVTKKLQDTFGHSTAQFLIGISSLFIGCGYCTYNHVLAGAILWFRDEDSLHPLDPHVVSELFEMRDHEIVERFRSLLAASEHQRLLQLALRMQELYLEEAEGTEEEDALLEACLWIWRWTTECTIVEGIHMEPGDANPNHSIGRDRKLRARYEQARARQTTR